MQEKAMSRATPVEAAWRCHEQSGHPLARPRRYSVAGLPPIEARPQATSGSDPAKSGEPLDAIALDARFTALVARHRVSLYRTALRQLGNPDDAQDALQDALLSAYRHLDQFAGRSAIATWMTRIVINAARGQRRRALARPASSLEVAVAAGRQFPDGRPGPEARLSSREQSQTLARLIAQLPSPLRVAVESCDLANVPVSLAAQRLGIKPDTLYGRLHRARQRLAALHAREA